MIQQLNTFLFTEGQNPKLQGTKKKKILKKLKCIFQKEIIL